MSPTAKSLILDLLSTLRSGSMPVRALLEAARLFGLSENNVRVNLARLHATGLVERDERGRYRIGRGAEPVTARVASWRQRPERLVDWRGDWIAVHAAGAGPARLRRSRRSGSARDRTLRLLGFRELAPGLALRPDNWAGGVAAVRDQAAALGLESGDLVAGLNSLDSAMDIRARGLWDTDALCAEYARSCQELAASTAGLASASVEESMVETFRVGGRVLRQLVLDPLLPEPMVPSATRQALFDDMRAYDLLGRRCWTEFLARFDVPHLRSPTDVRVGEAAGLDLSLPPLVPVES